MTALTPSQTGPLCVDSVVLIKQPGQRERAWCNRILGIPATHHLQAGENATTNRLALEMSGSVAKPHALLLYRPMYSALRQGNGGLKVRREASDQR